MKKSNLVLIATMFLMLNSNAFSQSGWFSQNPVSAGTFLTGWVTGLNGLILKTTNGGDNWLPQTSGISLNLYSVFFTDDNTGWAVGRTGTILKTTNGGDNWLPQTSGTTSDLNSVQFFDNNTGWIAGNGGRILKTTNSGLNWSTQISGMHPSFNEVNFVDNNTGWAAGLSGIIVKTTNGGDNWSSQTSVGGLNLYSVYFNFTDINTGWATGLNTILKTTNGGDNWLPQGGSGTLQSVFFADNNTGWSVGWFSAMLKTTNGGQTWLPKPSGSSSWFYSVQFTDINTGWTVGTGGTILKTTNGGDSWSPQTSGTTVVLYSVFFLSDIILPVELSSFTSYTLKNNVSLLWSTSSETNNAGFDIERSSSDGEWTKVGNIPGNGTTTESKNYSFTDKTGTGKYFYRIKQIDFNGSYRFFNLSNEVVVGIPSEYNLSQNYPNPFNPSTKIDFELRSDTKVRLTVYDISGKEAASLVNEFKKAGYYTVNFNASDLASGVYFYKLEAEGFTDTKRMVLVK